MSNILVRETLKRENHPIPLSKAGVLFARVRGTSTKSVYIVLALGPTLKLAGRLKGKGLSLRLEGSAIGEGDVLERLAGIGVTKSGDEHASVHFEIAEQGGVAKAVGAILAAVGFGRWTEIAQNPHEALS